MSEPLARSGGSVLLLLGNIVLSTFLVLGCQAAEPFESELWPGEGIPRFAAKVDRLTLYEQPSRSSSLAGARPIKKDQAIAYSATLVRTVRPGLVTATESTTLSGRSFGDIGHLSMDRYYAGEPGWNEVPFAAGESFEYLQDRAEGSCLIRRQRVVFEIEACPWLGGAPDSGFKLVEEPVTEWWIRVEGKEKQPLGWLLVDEESVDLLPRGF